MKITRITDQKIAAQFLVQNETHPECGAISTFDGIVRNHHEGKSVLKLEYSCYHKMAELELDRILSETQTLWPDCHARATHRVGELQIGDIAVAIAVWAPHRQEAFAACSHVIESIKARLPVWKKEFYEDGTVNWVLCSHHHSEVKKSA